MSQVQLSFRIAQVLVRRLVIPIFTDLRVTGLEHVPKTGPFIMACNHFSMTEVPIFFAVLPRRPRTMAKLEVMNSLFIGPLGRWVRAIPVKRNGFDRAALRTAAEVLADGDAFGIFPEGTRSKTGRLLKAQPGAGLLALRSGAPVLPIAFYGTDKIFEGDRPHFRHRSSMSIGPLLTAEELKQAGGPAEATEIIMRRIARMLPPSARGEYGEQPTPTTSEDQPASQAAKL